MSSKEEIKLLYIDELKKCYQYGVVLKLKQVIIDSIVFPDIQSEVSYSFQVPMTDAELGIFKQCFLVEFGFEIVNVSNVGCVIAMKYFLS